jgi:asparagine synthase (glutamine-hydrolysing)
LSGIAAVIRFDGGRVEPGAVEAMTGAMHYRGVDGIAHWSDGQAALGHCMLHTTAESLQEKQPLVSADAMRVLVFDGWLSNPEELRSDLMARGARLRDKTDAELVLHAYEAWGDECPRRIDGEFAFLIWDKQRREVFLARDHVGIKSLQYVWDGARLTVASDMVGIFAAPGIDARPNRGKIAEYLTCEFTEAEETIWQGVLRPPAAHWMRFGAQGASRGRFWQPPREIEIAYRRDEDYVEHYREMFADCVRRASRTHLPLACDASGGLDSSAIFAMAHDLRRKGKLLAPDVRGYTYFFRDHAGSEIDEIEYARAVAAHVGAEISEIEPFLPASEWFVERGRADRDFAGYPNGAMRIGIGNALTADGCRVDLTGEGGDEWLTGKPFFLSELIDERNWPELFGELKQHISQSGLHSAAWKLFRFGFAHRFPPSILNFRRTILKHWKREKISGKDWLAPELRQMLDQRKASAGPPDDKSIRNAARRAMQMTLSDPYIHAVRDQISRQTARQNYELRLPMYSRSFIQFAFTTPEKIKLRNGLYKFTHRQAMRDLLPEVVADRTSKALGNISLQRHVLEESYETLAQVIANSRSGHIDPMIAINLVEQYRKHPTRHELMWPIWGMFAIESLF